MLRSKRVLKIALNKQGIAQNEAEINIFTNPITKPIVAKVYDYDPNFLWIISELVRPSELHPPVEPKPSDPRDVSDSSSTSNTFILATGAITSCAMRSPGFMFTTLAPKLIRITLICPL